MNEAVVSEKIDNNNVSPSDNSNNNVEINKSDVPSDISPSSGVSSASSKSAVSKQSGIRPPSRIGRPCGGIHKPAIPATPTKNSSDDSMRRLTDDFGRHKLTDSSAVLTEDTDSFMIGQRVWVGGTKPGTIAYIGETQFAPGDWAGIALEEPIGKNDGSVGGIRYFQCENKKGVFSKLTRLTRVPLEQPGMGSNETFISPNNNGVRRSPVSPTGSTSGLLRSPVSLSNSNTSLASNATHIIDFKPGDRVIIKSTQGSKIGTVRYMGLTHFAPGEWVGVELDDPRGKNDGSVEGKRYFECRPHFGLFAPISKVSKSPSKHKPSACVVHSGPGLPPSGLKRANSKESMVSLASKTSAASNVRRVRLGVTSLTPKKVAPKTSTPLPTRTALQDVLREKQQHIEQLLKERDLERAEITRAASQADEAEHRFYTLKQEFEKYRAECEQKVRADTELLSQFKIDRDAVLNLLEEEKRKNEDLQFRFEEASITKSDVEAVNENQVKKIGDLELKLAEERRKNETLEATSNKLFEAEENLIKTREEVDSLKKEVEESRQKRSAIEEERTVSASVTESLKSQIERIGRENEEKSRAIDLLREEIAKITSEDERMKRETTEYKEKSGENCQEKDNEIEKLRSELAHEKKLNEKYRQTHAEMAKEIEKLKMDLSAKSLDLETANEEITAKDHEIKLIRNELETVMKEVSEKIDDLERHKTNSKEVEQNLRKEIEHTRDDLKAKISEVEMAKKECNVEISQKDQQLQEADKTVTEIKEEMKKLTDELSSAKTSFEESKSEIHSRHARQVASQDSQLMALSSELEQKNEEITKSSIVISKLEEDLCTKNGIIEKLRLELESCENRHSTHSETSAAMGNKVKELILGNGELQGQLSAANERIRLLISEQHRLQNEIQALSARGDNAALVEQLRNELQARQNMLESLRIEYEEKLQSVEKNRHQLELEYQTALGNFEHLRNELESKLQISQQAEELLKQRCEVSVSEIAKARDEYRLKITDLEKLLHQKDFALSNLDTKAQEASRNYEEQLRLVNEELNRNLQGCQQKVSSLNNELLLMKDQFVKKSEEFIEARAETSHILAKSQQNEKELTQKHNEDLKRIEFDLNEKALQLQKALSELQLLKNDCHSTNTDLQSKDHKIGELSAEVQQCQSLISKQQEQLNVAQSAYQQDVLQHETVQQQCQGLLDQVALLKQQVGTGEEIYKNLQFEHQQIQQLMHRLKLTEQQKQQCLSDLQNEVAVGGQKQNCQHAMEVLKQIKIDNKPEDTEKLLNLQRDLNGIRNQLIERNQQFDVQRKELLRLQEQLLRAQDTNTRCTEGHNDQNSLIQDRELAENQIKFLNSIIVDIQKKNEEQRARIEILEAGCSPAMADELKLIGNSTRQVPPRVYCDICEEFDLHETEDCPQQNTDVAPSNGRGRKQMQERPYCEICEAFGHATEDCQEDQTF